MQFSHIVEGMTCNVLNPLTDALGIDAIKRIYKWLPIAVKEPDNLEARENMAIAVTLRERQIQTHAVIWDMRGRSVLGQDFT